MSSFDALPAIRHANTLTASLPPCSPSPPMGPQRVALGDWSGAMASLETCGKSAHPASQAKSTPACWSDVISEIGGTRKDFCTQLIYGHWSRAPESKIFSLVIDKADCSLYSLIYLSADSNREPCQIWDISCVFTFLVCNWWWTKHRRVWEEGKLW